MFWLNLTSTNGNKIPPQGRNDIGPCYFERSASETEKSIKAKPTTKNEKQLTNYETPIQDRNDKVFCNFENY